MMKANNHIQIIRGTPKHYEKLDFGNTRGGTRKATKQKIPQNDGPRIVYQAFANAGDYARDEYWREIFKDASHGKFITGFNFDGETISCVDENGNQVQKYLNTDSPYDLYKEFHTFLQDYGNVFSPEEIENYNNRCTDATIESITTWSKLKTETLKNKYINKFVESISKNAKLTKNESDDLNHLIRLGISAGYFNKNNIKISGCQIKCIEGLEYDNGTYYINTSNFKSKVSRNKSGAYSLPSDTLTDYTSQGQNSFDDTPMLVFTKLDFFKKWVKLIEYLEKKKT